MHRFALSIPVPVSISFYCLFALSALLLAARGVRADSPLLDYVDPQYHFTFQYPSDWTLDSQVKPGTAGETRVVVRDPQSSTRAIASIGRVGEPVSKSRFEALPNRETVVQGLMQLSLKQIYERASQELHATKMVVGGQQALPSDAGIKFYISTVHAIEKTTVVIAGMHIVPFDKPYMISFIMISPFKQDGARQAAINKVFNSFRLVAPPPP